MIEVRWTGEWVDVGDYSLPEFFALGHTPGKGSDAPTWVINFEVIEGVPQCRRVLIESTTRGREVQSADLRGLRIEDLLEGAATNVAHREDASGEYHRPFVGEWREVVRGVRKSRRDGRRKITDELLRSVAEVYRANVEQNPTQAVGEHLGVADRTARLYVRRARDAGFLGESIKGKGGEA